MHVRLDGLIRQHSAQDGQRCHGSEQQPQTTGVLGHFVYRIYDADDVLLYIGATSNLQRRTHEHKSQTPRMTTWTAQEYPTRQEAFAAERQAIAAENPEVNIKCRKWAA